MSIEQQVKELIEAKDKFNKWLQENNAECIGGLRNDDNDIYWHYYSVIEGFIDDSFYRVCFSFWKGHNNYTIGYNDDYSAREFTSISDFENFIYNNDEK